MKLEEVNTLGLFLFIVIFLGVLSSSSNSCVSFVCYLVTLGFIIIFYLCKKIDIISSYLECVHLLLIIYSLNHDKRLLLSECC